MILEMPSHDVITVILGCLIATFAIVGSHDLVQHNRKGRR